MAAIYTPQWILDIYVTTTLYPIDVTESMAVSCSPVDEAGWWPLLIEEMAGNLSLVSATLYAMRFTAPLQGPEEMAGNLSLVSATLIHVVVDADTPDEMLEISCAPTTDSTMTPV